MHRALGKAEAWLLVSALSEKLLCKPLVTLSNISLSTQLEAIFVESFADTPIKR